MTQVLSNPLRRLARLHGVQLSYVDAEGVRRAARREPLEGVLRALGVDVDSEAGLADQCREAERAEWIRPLPPVVVAWDGVLRDLPLRLPASEARGEASLEIRLEDGGVIHTEFSLSGEAPQGATELDGVAYVRLAPVEQFGIPAGYHQLTLTWPRGQAQSRLLSAPMRVWSHGSETGGSAPSWGAFAPLYALRREDDWGIGDFTSLERTGRWIASLNEPEQRSLLGVLPLQDCFLDEPYAFSPYTPITRLFWNEVFIDPTRAPEWDRCESARAAISERAAVESLEAARSSRIVDYREVARLKTAAIDAMADYLIEEGGSRKDELLAWSRARPEAARYARFRAAAKRAGAGWGAWPAHDFSVEPPQELINREEVERRLYAQWLAESQLRAADAGMQSAGADLYLDMTLGVHPDGFDTWRFHDSFAQGVSTGAPPDALFSGGQNWGFPPLHPTRIRENGHEYWIRAVRAQMSAARVLRIDHVLGLHRLYWIPEGVDARQGVYVRYPAEEMYAVLSIESHRARSRIVGENLGTVPAYINRAMDRHDLARMHVAQFTVDPKRKRPIKAPPSRSLASFNTHDTP
ncbi:MAG: 4-alpha-glucanotransferase, partial [Planctomycetota bacterium]|nr:4-alpha-glucanotransferase [Planctomycetota bacterium]